jgi:uncharacterized membrane protein YGL010W
MTEYEQDHRHPTNQLIHKICVPLIMFSVIGILWGIPTPFFLEFIPFLNWATIFIIGSLLFYMSLSLKMFVAMLIQSLIMCWICLQLDKASILLPFSTVVFYALLDCAILRSQD